MNKRLYHFLINYQWYFAGVYFYFFIRGYGLIKEVRAGLLLMEIWLIVSGVITLFTQFYIYQHKDNKPVYAKAAILLCVILTVLIIELIV